MKKLKRSNVYKANNVKFDADAMEATSYDWWLFFKVINGKNVFNNYYYSPSTSKHQSKIRCLLSDLNIKIDHFIKAPRGLQDLNEASDHYKYLIKTYKFELEKALSNPRVREKKLNSLNDSLFRAIDGLELITTKLMKAV